MIIRYNWLPVSILKYTDFYLFVSVCANCSLSSLVEMLKIEMKDVLETSFSDEYKAPPNYASTVVMSLELEWLPPQS